eukprot:NODE_13846_length_239_cov_0.777174.p3 GENE.NODE_13846_length_239_cov_0.777174~~NODE_13846_length_239_cov_0.777174.p3  ORF type:complete len:52 (-),score=8.52 NODE_13846_length_239_cov_0.777174:84-239(-)
MMTMWLCLAPRQALHPRRSPSLREAMAPMSGQSGAAATRRSEWPALRPTIF